MPGLRVGHNGPMRMIAAVLANAAALLATTVVPGVDFEGSVVRLLLAGAILGLFNLLVRPLALFLSIPALILTLGLFYLVLNGALLWLASFVLPGYSVDGLLPGILGAMVMGVVNWAFGTLFRREEREELD